jgi:hypothetical protein
MGSCGCSIKEETMRAISFVVGLFACGAGSACADSLVEGGCDHLSGRYDARGIGTYTIEEGSDAAKTRSTTRPIWGVFKTFVDENRSAELLRLASGEVVVLIRGSSVSLSRDAPNELPVKLTFNLTSFGVRCVDGQLVFPEKTIVIARGAEGTRGSHSTENKLLLLGPEGSLLYREQSDTQQNGFFFRPKIKMRAEFSFRRIDN